METLMLKMLAATVLFVTCTLANAFTLDGHKWEKTNVTFGFDDSTPPNVRESFRKQFAVWQEYALNNSIKFQEVDLASSGGDIQIHWSLIHFVNMGMTVAYTSFPTPPNAPITSASITVDSWYYDPLTLYSDKTLDQFGVDGTALHEIGHALGLGHSHADLSIMRLSIGTNAQLWRDDVDGIHALYGLSDEFTVFKSTYDKLGIAYTYPLNHPTPKEPYSRPYISNTYCLLSGSTYFYFDFVSGNYLGSLVKGKKYMPRIN